jgi:hypothetical protein
MCIAYLRREKKAKGNSVGEGGGFMWYLHVEAQMSVGKEQTEGKEKCSVITLSNIQAHQNAKRDKRARR